MTAPSRLPAVVEHGVGLVVMLDAAGRTIAELERDIERLSAAVAEERRLRLELADLLRAAREATATGRVPQTPPSCGDTCDHDHDTAPLGAAASPA